MLRLLAHAFGARYDLPVPLALFVLGGAAVVFLSFLLVLPRPVHPHAEPAAPPARPPRRITVRGAISLAITAFLVVGGFTGSQEVAENLLPIVFWLFVWVVTPISCGVLGDWTRSVNPFAVIARLADSQRARDLLIAGPAFPWPKRLGYWVAVVLFLLVASGELIFNGTATLPGATALGITLYALVSAAAGLLVGAAAWTERGELFSVLFSTWGRLGFFRFDAGGRRGFGGGLETFEATVSRITFVLLLLVSVGFDGLLSTPAWQNLRLRLAFHVTSLELQLTTVGVFIGLLAATWLAFGAFSLLVARAGRLERSPLAVFAALLPSLLPISLGYLIAHNLSYITVNAQLVVPLLGDPFGLGWKLLPYPFNDSYVVHTSPLPSEAIWYMQVAVIVAVHIWAVLVAHRQLGHAARTAIAARRAEWPWIVAMVGYTMTSLWLLAQPLVREG